VKIATADTAPVEPGGTALEGTLGSTVETAILPSFDALYFTFALPPDQDVGYDKKSLPELEFNIWKMAGEKQIFGNTITARFYSERTYEVGDPNIPNPIPDGCDDPPPQNFTLTVNGVQKNYVKIICKGPFGYVDGYFLRVIACGKPNQEVLKSVFGEYQSAEGTDARRIEERQRVAAFLARAWLQGEGRLPSEDPSQKTLWDQDLCPTRLYGDYPFKGADAGILGELVSGEIYFIVQFPQDYEGNEAIFGPPKPVFSGMTVADLGHYITSRDLNKFLYNGHIVQVVWGNYDGVTTTAEYTNIPLGELFQVTREETAASLQIPPDVFCQDVDADSWDGSRVTPEDTLMDLINQARATARTCGVEGNFAAITTPLNRNGTLRCAARVHSKDMSEHGFFAHLSPTTGSELNRIYTAGIQPPLPGSPGLENPNFAGTIFGMGGENIAEGPTDPAQVVQEWLASPGHCANLMSPVFTHLGSGYYPGSGDNPVPHWTLTLGTPWK
jgi:uncharacterized protein YkwD